MNAKWQYLEKKCNGNIGYQNCVCATCKHTDVRIHYPDVNSEITLKCWDVLSILC